MSLILVPVAMFISQNSLRGHAIASTKMKWYIPKKKNYQGTFLISLGPGYTRYIWCQEEVHEIKQVFIPFPIKYACGSSFLWAYWVSVRPHKIIGMKKEMRRIDTAPPM